MSSLAAEEFLANGRVLMGRGRLGFSAGLCWSGKPVKDRVSWLQKAIRRAAPDDAALAVVDILLPAVSAGRDGKALVTRTGNRLRTIAIEDVCDPAAIRVWDACSERWLAAWERRLAAGNATPPAVPDVVAILSPFVDCAKQLAGLRKQRFLSFMKTACLLPQYYVENPAPYAAALSDMRRAVGLPPVSASMQGSKQCLHDTAVRLLRLPFPSDDGDVRFVEPVYVHALMDVFDVVSAQALRGRAAYWSKDGVAETFGTLLGALSACASQLPAYHVRATRDTVQRLGRWMTQWGRENRDRYLGLYAAVLALCPGSHARPAKASTAAAIEASTFDDLTAVLEAGPVMLDVPTPEYALDLHTGARGGAGTKVFFATQGALLSSEHAVPCMQSLSKLYVAVKVLLDWGWFASPALVPSLAAIGAALSATFDPTTKELSPPPQEANPKMVSRKRDTASDGRAAVGGAVAGTVDAAGSKGEEADEPERGPKRLRGGAGSSSTWPAIEALTLPHSPKPATATASHLWFADPARRVVVEDGAGPYIAAVHRCIEQFHTTLHAVPCALSPDAAPSRMPLYFAQASTSGWKPLVVVFPHVPEFGDTGVVVKGPYRDGDVLDGVQQWADVLARPSWAPDSTLFWFRTTWQGTHFLFTPHLAGSALPQTLVWAPVYTCAPSKSVRAFYPGTGPGKLTLFGWRLPRDDAAFIGTAAERSSDAWKRVGRLPDSVMRCMLNHFLLRFVLGLGDSGPHNCLGGVVAAWGCDYEEAASSAVLSAAKGLITMLGKATTFGAEVYRAGVVQALTANQQWLLARMRSLDVTGLTSAQLARLQRVIAALQVMTL